MIKREYNMVIIYIYWSASSRRCAVCKITQLNQTATQWYLIAVFTWTNIKIFLYFVPLCLYTGHFFAKVVQIFVIIPSRPWFLVEGL
jgi:hypothetical protein